MESQVWCMYLEAHTPGQRQATTSLAETERLPFTEKSQATYQDTVCLVLLYRFLLGVSVKSEKI